MAIKINGLYFAESDAEYEKNRFKYRGFVKRYKRKMEFYDKQKNPRAVINKFGAILDFDIVGGDKRYKMAWKDGSADKLLKTRLGLAIGSDLRRISKKVLERSIDTRPDGGIFADFPDDEYWYK